MLINTPPISTTEVLCCAYAVDGSEIELWLPGDPVPAPFIAAANDSSWIVSGFNVGFERVITERVMVPRHGWPLIPLEQYRCSQAAAQALALPASLGKTAAALGLEHQKDADGQRLMLQMAKPRHPRKGEDPAGIYWFEDSDWLDQLYDYCKQDVAAERAIYNRIGHLSAAEQAVWVLDATINDRGITVDRQMIDGAIRISTTAQKAIDAELCAITQGVVEKVSQVERLKAWLKDKGLMLADADKEAVSKVLKRTDLLDDVRRALELRCAGAHISSTKFKAMRNHADRNGRVRGAHKYHAAGTGRWASWGVQIQNIKKPAKDLDLAEAIEAISTGDYDKMRGRYDGPLRVVGEAARAAICAARGHRFIAADFSGIESRVLAYLADEQSKLDLWAKFDQTGAKEDEPYLVLGKQFGFPDPVVINATTGVLEINRIYIDVGRNYKASRWKTFWTIALPGALPVIMTGFKLGIGIGLILIAIAEMIGAKSGLGYMIWTAWETFSVEQMYVGLFTIAIIGFVLTIVLNEIERIIIPWKRD